MSWLSSILGLDASHNASVANASAQSLKTSAGNQFGAIGTQGTNAYNTGQAQMAPLQQLLGQTAGVAGYGQNPSVPGTSKSLTGNAAKNSAQGEAQNAQQAQQANNPYNLQPQQQAALNSQLNSVAQQAQSSIASFTQQMASQGITDPRALEAGKQSITQQYTQYGDTLSANFAQAAQQQQMQAITQMLGLASNQQSLGLQGEQIGAGGTASLAGAQQQNANYQQQQAQAAFGQILQLVGAGASGAFGNLFGDGLGPTPKIVDSESGIGFSSTGGTGGY